MFSDDYDHIMKTSIRRRLEEEQQIGRSLTEADIRKLLVPQDYGLSWSQLNRYDGIMFESAGTYKVCGCDSAVAGSPCTTPEQFTVDIGKVHVSGLQCLLGKPEFARGTCVAQEYGGLRCYQDGAPAISSPFDKLGVPDGLYKREPYLLGAGPDTLEKVRLFCVYGTDKPYMYDFCETVMGADYVPPDPKDDDDDDSSSSSGSGGGTPPPTAASPTPKPTFAQ